MYEPARRRSVRHVQPGRILLAGQPGRPAAGGGGLPGQDPRYLNPALLNAGLTQEFVYPDEAAWKVGVRTTVCEVSSSTGQLTGSVRS